MGTIGLLVLFAIIVFLLRKSLIKLIVMAIVAVFVFNMVINQARQTVSAGVDSVTSIPSQLVQMAKDKFNEYFAEGNTIMKPLIDAAAERDELYQYCLADTIWVSGKENPMACQALSGRERTACLENHVKNLKSINGISDISQIDDLRTLQINRCSERFNVRDAMTDLLDAGLRGVGELYGYCKVQGACIESDFDNAPYRNCLYNKFSSPRPEGLGLTTTYCSEFNASEDREKWRKCMEVAMIQQTAGDDLALEAFNTNQIGVRAIRACRQL